MSLPAIYHRDTAEYCIPPHHQDRIYSVFRQISVSCLLRADYELLIFFSRLFGFFPTLRIFQLWKFICKLINDRHLTPRYEKMRAHCSSLQIGLCSNSFSCERSEKVLEALKVVDRGNLQQTSSVLEGSGGGWRGGAYMQTRTLSL